MDCRPEIGITLCEGPDLSGCWFWGNPVTCPVGCACASEPSKANTMVCVADGPQKCADKNQCCAIGQRLCMNDQKYRACKPDAEGCLIWDCSS
jgi:energy-converting hydrogenase Eha subunit B